MCQIEKHKMHDDVIYNASGCEMSLPHIFIHSYAYDDALRVEGGDVFSM